MLAKQLRPSFAKKSKILIELYDIKGTLVFEEIIIMDIKANSSTNVYSDKKNKVLNGLNTNNIMLLTSIDTGGVIRIVLT